MQWLQSSGSWSSKQLLHCCLSQNWVLQAPYPSALTSYILLHPCVKVLYKSSLLFEHSPQLFSHILCLVLQKPPTQNSHIPCYLLMKSKLQTLMLRTERRSPPLAFLATWVCSWLMFRWLLINNPRSPSNNPKPNSALRASGGWMEVKAVHKLPSVNTKQLS